MATKFVLVKCWEKWSIWQPPNYYFLIIFSLIDVLVVLICIFCSLCETKVYIPQSTLSKTSGVFFFFFNTHHGKYTNFTPRGKSSLHGEDSIVVPFVVNVCYQIQKKAQTMSYSIIKFLVFV
jgi:hypothetical protein